MSRNRDSFKTVELHCAKCGGAKNCPGTYEDDLTKPLYNVSSPKDAMQGWEDELFGLLWDEEGHQLQPSLKQLALLIDSVLEGQREEITNKVVDMWIKREPALDIVQGAFEFALINDVLDLLDAMKESGDNKK